MNWDVRSHHSDQLSFRSSATNSEIDIDSRPSSVIDNKPLDDSEMESFVIDKRVISTFEGGKFLLYFIFGINGFASSRFQEYCRF